MGARTMKKLRVGYVPISKNLTAPGDRRRIVFWAKSRGHEIVTDLEERVDLLVLSEKSDLNLFAKSKKSIPIIFDLVDGYLARESIIEDLLRGTAKVATRQLSGMPRTFTHSVQELCSTVSAVVCSSPEQKEMITKYSKNVHVILDSHDEIPWLDFRGAEGEYNKIKHLLWEGLPVTLGGIKTMNPALIHENAKYGTRIKFVTNKDYHRLLGQYFPASTETLLQKLLGPMNKNSEVVSWSVENLVSSAKNSSAAIIPVMVSNRLQYLKPENRLLIMWKLGLPTLTSATPAYSRVSKISESDITCESSSEWEAKLTLVHDDNDYAEELVHRGQKYLKENHTKELLLLKWDKAIYSVL
jgi:hypothetical protein